MNRKKLEKANKLINEIDRELSDKILSTINTFIKEKTEKLNKEFREL